MRHRSALYGIATASIVAFGLFVVLGVGLAVRLTRSDDPRLLALTLGSFRDHAATDFLAGAKAWGGEELAGRAAAIEPVLWPVSPPRAGWSWLVSTAVATVAGPGSERPLSAFYNPWADVVLVAEWRRANGLLKLTDLDVLPADCVRRGGRPPFSFETAWVRPDRFPPAALHATTVETLLAFERRFPQGAEGGAWRARLSPGGEDVWTTVLRPAAGLLCGRALVAISEYRHAERGEPRLLSQVRPVLDHALTEARAGRAASLLAKAQPTSPASREALAQAPLGGLALTSLLLGSQRAYAFAVDPRRPGAVVAFSFDAKEGRATLVRVDALGLPGAGWLRAGGRS